MSIDWLPSNSRQLLDEIVHADDPVQMLCNRFEIASEKEDAELRGILRELRQKGYIDVQWADNVPYYITINNSARTYNEQIARFESEQVSQKTTERSNKNPIIFISHRSTDQVVADMLLDFFSSTEIPRSAVFCSSLPGNDINEKISAEVKSKLKDSNLNIVILSHDYYQSAYCLNEAGVLWYRDDVRVIPIALPEIDENKMYGFLNSEYKLRRLDSNTDISYIYDVVRETTKVESAKAAIVSNETQKLINRYSDFLKGRGKTILKNNSIIVSDLTTDDERIVMYYILDKNIRKVSKDAITEWLHKNEVFDVNIDNAFDLLSSFGNSTVNNDTLELDIPLFRKFSSYANSLLPELKPCLNNHVRLAADTFKELWNSRVLDSSVILFIAYIIEERIFNFGDRWMAEEQTKSIKQWEAKNSLDSTLSDNYGSCLAFFKHNHLVYESSRTRNGAPREYTLYPSLQNLFFNHSDGFVKTIQQVKDEHYYNLPF